MFHWHTHLCGKDVFAALCMWVKDGEQPQFISKRWGRPINVYHPYDGIPYKHKEDHWQLSVREIFKQCLNEKGKKYIDYDILLVFRKWGRGGLEKERGTLVPCGRHNKLPQTLWLKTKEINCVTMCLKSTCQQGHAPSQGLPAVLQQLLHPSAHGCIPSVSASELALAPPLCCVYF